MIKKILFVFACLISFASTTQAQVVYKDVAPIFYSRCSSCHHEGSIYPPLNYYSSINNFKGVIAYNLNTGKMPPWMPDTTYARFSHERIITMSEKTKILNWITAGAPYGTTLADTALAPPAPIFPKTKLNGTPDLIIKIPNFTSLATSADRYECFSIPTNLVQDRMIKAYEIVPNNPSIIHHAVLEIDTTGASTTETTGSCYNINGGHVLLGDYAPGSAPIVFPSSSTEKFGLRIKQGSKMIAQMHYPAGSAGIVDSTEIRLFFYPVGTTNVRQIYTSVPLQNWSFLISANTTATVTAKYPSGANTLPIDLSILSIFPHSHKICESIVNWASNGTDTIPMCRINKWDFNWQGFYTYPKFLKVPAGYKLHAKHVFNNTTSNPNNPSPALVTAGFATENEMLFDGIMYMPYQTGDELIDIDGMLSADPLLQPVNVQYLEKTFDNISVYPNPFTDKVKINYTLMLPQFTKLSITNIMGQEVATLNSGIEAAGLHSYEWDGKNSAGAQLTSGVYFYKLQLGTKTQSGKLILKSKN